MVDSAMRDISQPQDSITFLGTGGARVVVAKVSFTKKVG
jgi:hypothetical protein